MLGLASTKEVWKVSVKPTQVDKHSEEVRARFMNNQARTRKEQGEREATIAHSSAAVAVPPLAPADERSEESGVYAIKTSEPR